MPRYFIQLSYNGTAYHGWQVQENTPHTVQQVINETLSKILNEPISVTGCGRTDTGVHAKDFYAHFDCSKEELAANQEKWLHKFNAVLPHDIAVFRIIPVHSEASSRFDAVSRTYEYILIQKKDPFLIDGAYYLFGDLDMEAMNRAAVLMFEYSDFSSFSKSNTQTFTNNCRVTRAEWRKDGDDKYIFTVTADRFLRNMVRAIVGTLLEVGTGKSTADDFRKVIESKNRSNAGFSVPACGLYLTKVEYPRTLFHQD